MTEIRREWRSRGNVMPEIGRERIQEVAPTRGKNPRGWGLPRPPGGVGVRPPPPHPVAASPRPPQLARPRARVLTCSRPRSPQGIGSKRV